MFWSDTIVRVTNYRFSSTNLFTLTKHEPNTVSTRAQDYAFSTKGQFQFVHVKFDRLCYKRRLIHLTFLAQNPTFFVRQRWDDFRQDAIFIVDVKHRFFNAWDVKAAALSLLPENFFFRIWSRNFSNKNLIRHRSFS